jgi:hypothetical protein
MPVAIQHCFSTTAAPLEVDQHHKVAPGEVLLRERPEILDTRLR